MLATSVRNSVVDNRAILSAITDRDAQLQLIQALTEKMLQMAERQAWENVSKLEAERTHLITSFFDTKPTVDEAERVANVIVEVLGADKKIIVLSASEQQKMLSNAQKINVGKQAAKAYAMLKK